MRPLFNHALTNERKFFAVPNLRDRFFIDVTQNGIVVTTHRYVAVWVVDLKMSPRMLTNKLAQNKAFPFLGTKASFITGALVGEPSA